MNKAMEIGLIILVTLVVAVVGMDKHTLFMNSLSNISRYDKRIRPLHKSSVLNINISITIVSFGDVEEMKSEFSLDIFFAQYWVDPRLAHTEGTVTLIGADRHLIWLPDTYFTNVKDAQHHNVPVDNSRVIIRNSGLVGLSSRITLSAACEMDLHEYPLDSQTCMLQIMSYAYDDGDIDYLWPAKKDNAIRIMNRDLAQLALKDVHIGRRKQSMHKASFTELLAIFTFRRRLGYSLLQVYAPTCLIVALSWLSFWISKDAVPARIALGITTILTIVTLNGSFRAAVPKVSYIKAMDLYLIVSFFFVFGAVMEYIAVLIYDEFLKQKKLSNKKFDIQESDDEDKDEEAPKKELDREGMTSTGAIHGSNLSLRSNPEQKQKRKKSSMFGSTLRLFGKILSVNSTPIDKVSKVAFPCCFLLFNAGYWLYYKLSKTKGEDLDFLKVDSLTTI